jgi:hypothetical protein
MSFLVCSACGFGRSGRAEVSWRPGAANAHINRGKATPHKSAIAEFKRLVMYATAGPDAGRHVQEAFDERRSSLPEMRQ